MERTARKGGVSDPGFGVGGVVGDVTEREGAGGREVEGVVCSSAHNNRPISDAIGPAAHRLWLHWIPITQQKTLPAW